VTPSDAAYVRPETRQAYDLGARERGSEVTGAGGWQVAQAMVTRPAVHPATTTIDQARVALENPHRHLLLLVWQRRLLGTIDRDDLSGTAGGAGPALAVARLCGRTVRADEQLVAVHAEMLAGGQRRRAVVHDDGVLLGLLCLKASGSGFCAEQGIAARARGCLTA